MGESGDGYPLRSGNEVIDRPGGRERDYEAQCCVLVASLRVVDESEWNGFGEGNGVLYVLRTECQMVVRRYFVCFWLCGYDARASQGAKTVLGSTEQGASHREPMRGRNCEGVRPL